MTAQTYTKRTNAKRAGIKAGVPEDQIEITVHKSKDSVRFGWKRRDAEPAPATTLPATEPRSIRNGVKQPREGTICRRVWDWLDAHADATVKDVKAWAESEKLNTGNAQIEFYQRRKYHAKAA